MKRLEKKVAVITGGGSGIGKAMCILFAKEGAIVHILDLDSIGGNSVVQEIEKSEGIGYYHSCNVANSAEVKGIVQEIGKIDILVNNAGIAHVGNIENCSEDDFSKIFEVNVKGAFNVLKQIIPTMKHQKSGVILNLASIAALVGISDRFAYSMSKGAIHAMTMSIARDYIDHNIRCNSISPARVHTPFVDGFIAKNYAGKEDEMYEKLSASQPIGRMAKPEEIAQLALYLCSDDASFITGNDYPIDGGFIKLNN